MGEAPSVRLAERIEEFGLATGRLKTGTPPRLDGRTINWDVLELQPGDDDPCMMSFLNTLPFVRQINCGVTHTNENTHEIVRSNLDRSAMYGGAIQGNGPRYCPSIEDKIVRFAEKISHQVFLEPEGLDDATVYPNGLSTSLPLDVQVEYLRSIKGLERVEITQPGYAIEYDYVDPRSLGPSMEVQEVRGLFLAGQINGTTGYEEAAAQGLLAGLNAARSASGGDPVVLSRRESYIGVMVDDLTTRGVTEPYRMFTSRAEYRLTLRADNADSRLTPLGIDLGCVSVERQRAFEAKAAELDTARTLLQAISFTPTELDNVGVMVSQDGVRRSAYKLLASTDVSTDKLLRISPQLRTLSASALAQLAREALYAEYLQRQITDIEALKRDEGLIIPGNIDYSTISGLSAELRQKVVQTRPHSIAQAARIEGMTPAALTVLLGAIRAAGTKKSA